jgi:N-acetylglucosaminyldiphosphoundecaprenol N-acetyl-beta-D-mannosaminyltransferase
MQEICALAQKQGKTVYLLGSGFDVVVRGCREKLLQKFPDLRIVGVHKGPQIQERVNEDENDAVLEDIIMTAPDILFVAFGHIKQEKWIYEFLPDLPSVRVAMGVGGSFDFISGKVRRAPKVFQKFGLEWLYRLVREPRRIKRIWKATVVFLFLYFKNK